MGPIGWLVAIGCLLVGASIGIWGLTEANKTITIWFVGFPGAICLVIGFGLELQKFTNTSPIERGLPYLSITPGGPQDFEVGKRVWVPVAIKNTGVGHAYRVRPDIALGILPYPLPTDYTIPTIPPSTSEFTLGIGETSVSKPVFIDVMTKEEMDAILDGTQVRLYLGGVIGYRLASGRECQTRVLQSIGGLDFIAALKLVRETGHSKLDWEYAPRHNDTNTECQ